MVPPNAECRMLNAERRTLQHSAFNIHRLPYPCRCLCLGFLLQIMRTTPRRLITLHHSQRRLTDARTCIIPPPINARRPPAPSYTVRSDESCCLDIEPYR